MITMNQKDRSPLYNDAMFNNEVFTAEELKQQKTQLLQELQKIQLLYPAGPEYYPREVMEEEGRITKQLEQIEVELKHIK